MRKYLLALLTVLFLFTSAVPAQAVTWEDPKVTHPIVRTAGDTGRITVVVQGPDNLYGMRRVIADFNERISNVYIHAARGIRCSDVANESQCITVNVNNWGYTWWAGYANYQVPNGSWCTIRLNKYWLYNGRLSQHVAGHEVGHCLGMDHHNNWGLMNPKNRYPNYATYYEIREFNRAYYRR